MKGTLTRHRIKSDGRPAVMVERGVSPPSASIIFPPIHHFPHKHCADWALCRPTI